LNGLINIKIVFSPIHNILIFFSILFKKQNKETFLKHQLNKKNHQGIPYLKDFNDELEEKRQSLLLCHDELNPDKPLVYRNQSNFGNTKNPNYDTIKNNYDTIKNIYKVKENYYFRKRIKNKLFRISLKTKSLTIALKRKKILNMIGIDEMYKMKLGDYKYIFEYDNVEELKEQIAITKDLHVDVLAEENKYIQVNNVIDQQNNANVPEKVDFSILEVKYVAHVKAENAETGHKLSEASYSSYRNTFNKLKEFFTDKPINEIFEADYRKFRKDLKDNKKLNAKTINIMFIYLNKFLDFAINKLKVIQNNEVKALRKMKEEDKIKELFSNAEINNLFTNKIYSNYHQNIFKILAHTGMRIGELHNIQQANVKKIDENNFLQIRDAKNESSNRDIPIPISILEVVQNTDFPISKKTKNAFNKELLTQLYKLIDKDSTKSLHTFRANFVSNCMNNFPELLEISQEIVGHSTNKETTIKTYGKGFNFENKLKIMNSVKYD